MPSIVMTSRPLAPGFWCRTGAPLVRPVPGLRSSRVTTVHGALARPARRRRSEALPRLSPVAVAARPGGAAASSGKPMRLPPSQAQPTSKDTQSFLASFEDSAASHVHIGAGRLGLGLVVPAIEASGIPYVILQRPSKAWGMLTSATAENVTLKVNGEAVSNLRIYTDAEIDDEDFDTEDLLVCSIGGCGHLILSSDVPTWDRLISTATSFSCSVGSSVATWLGPLLSGLPELPPGQQPVMYACENDSAAVKELQGMLEGKVEVIPCMVDRICADRTVTGDPDPTIDIQAEDHLGSIVLLSPPENPDVEVPLKGDGVTVPESAATGAFLYNRKLVMVNGMHTTLAFLTLVFNEMQRQKGGPGEVAGFACEDLTLMTFNTAPEEVKHDIWCWAVAQILKLMFENDDGVMRSAAEVETNRELVKDFLEIAKLNQKRFSSLDDTTARVLGGGVSTRYMGRLVPVQEAVHAVQTMAEQGDLEETSSLSMLLEEAGVELNEVATACDKLVGRAWRYCKRDEVLQSFAATGEALFKAQRGDVSVEDSAEDDLRKEAILLEEASENVIQGPVSNLDEKMVVVFDFDGTLADTEVIAMEVAYWLLAPYMPEVGPVGAASQLLTPAARDRWIEENAGRAFQFLRAKVDKRRKLAGLPSIQEAKDAREEDPGVLRRIDRFRNRLGLLTFADMRNPATYTEEPKDMDEQQRVDTLRALAKMAQPNNHVKDALENLTYLGIPLAIATTNSKPRVSLALNSAGLSDWFNVNNVHSGESDFDTPKFKPDPDVYLAAVEDEGATAPNCVAVEDSTSGVGAASNAGMGLIIGYCGSSHIPENMEEDHAMWLLSGIRSKSGQGADIVINDMENILPLVTFFKNLGDRQRPFKLPDALINQMKGEIWLPEDLETFLESDDLRGLQQLKERQEGRSAKTAA